MAERPGSSVSFNSNPMNSQTNLQAERVVPKNKKKKNIIKRIFGAIWATKQTKSDEENNDVLVKTTLKELILYVIFLAVITIVTFGMTNTINFYYSNIMMSLFLDQQTDPAVTGAAPLSFKDIGSYGDFWDVFNGPIMDGLYWETWYNGDNVTTYGLIYYENKLLGVPRLKQHRVKKNSCKVHKMFKNTIKECYDSYSFFNEDDMPFGKYRDYQKNAAMNDTAFYYKPALELKAPIVSGKISTYSAGGYVKNLDAFKDSSKAILDDLKLNTWLDRSTRVVMLDFTVYNANINMFCQIRLIVEFPTTGGAIPSWEFRTVKLIRYVTPFDYFILALEILFAVFLVYYTIEEAIEIKIHKCKYFKEVWNFLDIIILIIGFVCIGFNIFRTIQVNNILDSLLVNNDIYPEFNTLTLGQQQFNYAIAILTFLCWIKFFKYVSFNKTMNQLSETLGRCAKDVLGFSIMFCIVFFAYVQLGYLLFGTVLEDYSTLTNTIFALFRTILGDFDFPSLEAASRVMGPVYFISYIFFVFFVLINMFLAIINDTYSDVKSDISTSKSDIEFGTYFKRGYDKLLTKMHIKKEKLVDIQNALEMADENNDKEVTFVEWKNQLKKKGFSEVEIDAHFSKYDINGDQKLSADEQKQMAEDLKKQFNKVEQDMNEMKNSQEEETYEMTQEEKDEEERAKKANLVSHNEFKLITQRVDTMESSIGTIVNRIDLVLSKLESLEKTKLERREAMAKILDKLNEANNCPDPIRRAQLQQMVREDLEQWEVDTSVSLQAASRVGSATSRIGSGNGRSSTQTNINIEGKSAWRQQ